MAWRHDNHSAAGHQWATLFSLEGTEDAMQHEVHWEKSTFGLPYGGDEMSSSNSAKAAAVSPALSLSPSATLVSATTYDERDDETGGSQYPVILDEDACDGSFEGGARSPNEGARERPASLWAKEKEVQFHNERRPCLNWRNTLAGEPSGDVITNYDMDGTAQLQCRASINVKECRFPFNAVGLRSRMKPSADEVNTSHHIPSSSSVRCRLAKEGRIILLPKVNKADAHSRTRTKLAAAIKTKVIEVKRWKTSFCIILVFFLVSMQLHRQAINSTLGKDYDHYFFWRPQDGGDKSSLDLSNTGTIASFREVAQSSLPATTIIDGVTFPRNIGHRLYMGTGLWNSRMSLPRALSAMLGDDSAYVETPAFTICRLQLKYGRNKGKLMAAMRREIFQTSDKRRDWMGYYQFINNFQRTINCTSNEGEIDDVAAARLAQRIIDARFQNTTQLEDLVLALSTGQNLQQPEPSDLMFTTIYPNIAAQYYGPSLVIMKPDENQRGLDLGYYTAIGRSAEGKINSCEDAPQGGIDPIINDAGEIIFPGYKRPEDVVGFEIRREATSLDEIHVRDMPPMALGREVPSITHSFYKETIPDHGTALFLLHFPPGKVHCVEPSNKHNVHGSFFECESGGKPPTGDHCVMKNDAGDFTRPLQTIGMIFDEDFQGGCDSAEQVLLNILPHHQGLGNHTDYLRSQMFQNVLSSVSTKLGRGVFISYFTDNDEKIACNRVVAGNSDDLWQDHREVAASHVGLDTQMVNCMARVPLTWNAGQLIWSVSVGAHRHPNPLEYDAFGKQSMEMPQLLRKPPNWPYFLGLNKTLVSSQSCYGFKCSICAVNLTTDSLNGKVLTSCQLECTYTGNWLASLDGPSECHGLVRELRAPIVSSSDSMGFKRILNMQSKANSEDNLLSQATVDPLHFPLEIDQNSINIVMTSDIHAFILGQCNSQFCSSGASSSASLLKTVRLSSSISRSPTLVLDAGDALFGSGVAPGDVVSIMNKLGMDAMTLGNHDLDLGVDLLQEVAGNASFPILAANIHNLHLISRTLVRDSNIGGAPCRICVIGLSPPEPNPLAGKNISFAAKHIDVLVKELKINQDHFRCNMQLLLSHLGFNEDELIARELHKHLEGPLDLILGGHSHVIFGGNTTAPDNAGNAGTILKKSFPHFVDGVPIAHIGAEGMYSGIFSVSRITNDMALPMKRKSNFVVRGKLQPLGVDDGVFPDLEMKMTLPQDRKSGNNTSINIETYPQNFSVCNAKCRTVECFSGNFVTNAMRHTFEDAGNNNKPVIALLESGTLRSCLENTDDLTQMLPWPNKLVVMTMKGRTIHAMLQHGINNKASQGGFLQVSGIEYKYRSGKLLGVWESDTQHMSKEQTYPTVTFDSSVCESKKVCDSRTTKLDPNGEYQVVVTDWLASGGDGFGPIIKDCISVAHTNTTLQSAVLKYSYKHPIIRTEMRSWDADKETENGAFHAVAAFVGSLLATCLSYPLYSIAVLKATSMGSLRKDKSSSRLYDGVLLTAFAGALSDCLFYFFYYTFSFKHPMARAILGAVMNVLLTNPLWVIITRMQTSSNAPTILYTTKNIISEEGFSGFFDGLIMNLVMCIYPSIRQISFEVVHSFALQYFSTSHVIAGICGMQASCVANFLTYPIQRFRIRQQAALKSKACSLIHICDGVTFKLFHSGVSSFIFFSVISGSSELLDIIQG